MPTSARAIAAASLTPSPTMTTGPEASASSTACTLASGATPPRSVRGREAERCGDAPDDGGRIAREDGRAVAARRQPGQRGARVGADRVVEARPPDALPVDRDLDRRERPGRPPVPIPRHLVGRGEACAHKRRRADGHAPPGDDALDSAARGDDDVLDHEPVAGRPAPRGDERLGDGVARMSLEGNDERARRVGAVPVDEREPALGERAGLVEVRRAGRASASSAAPLLIRIPARAARPMATVTASGVASASAHGQVTMRSAIARSSAASGLVKRAIAYVAAAASEHGDRTNRPASRSASCTTGARLRAPASTSATSSADAASPPPRARRARGEAPPRLTVPAHTTSPGRTRHGRDSPVRSERSRSPSPARHDAVAGQRLAGAYLDDGAGQERLHRDLARGADRAAQAKSTTRAVRGVSAECSSVASSAARCALGCR